MGTYDTLRHFADSWMLLFLVLVFLAVVFWAFRPGGRRSQNEAATSIFRNENKPAQGDVTPDKSGDATSGKEGTK